MTEITDVEAWEVLDSRGEPTVRVRAIIAGGRGTGTFTVPAGASTGTHEAVERRDGGDRYRGRGVSAAVDAVEADLADVASGMDATNQMSVDATLRETDGTDDLSRLGGNAVLGVSGAVAHAAADALDVPLYEHLASLVDRDPGALPVPMVNIVSGGLHAEGGIEIQDFLAVPVGAKNYSEALETVWEVRQAVRDRIVEAGERPLVADEGGFAPSFDSIAGAFELLEAAILDAEHRPSPDDVAIAVDIAATHFWNPDTQTYELASWEEGLPPETMRNIVAEWCETRPLVSIEDPLAEDDWAGWKELSGRLDCQLLGDDLLATNPDRLDRAIESSAANAVLVKPNQAGTLSRAIHVITAAKNAGFNTVISARSGESCDSTVADLAVALDAEQIKIGSPARSERLAKYNRLLRIEDTVDGFAAPEFR